LSVSIENPATTLRMCSDACLLGDVTHSAFKKNLHTYDIIHQSSQNDTTRLAFLYANVPESTQL